MSVEERHEEVSSGEGEVRQSTSSPARRRYQPPRLECLGDVRDITLGGTPGTGDSPDPLNTQSPI